MGGLAVIAVAAALIAAAAAVPARAVAGGSGERAAAESSAAPAEAAGRVHLSTRSGLTRKGRRYAMKGQAVKVRGSFTAAPGGRVEVELFRKRKRGKRFVQKIDRKGRIEFKLRLPKASSYRIAARLEGRPDTEAKSLRIRTMNPRAGGGARGLRVRLLQDALRSLGYAAPRNGRFDAATSRAVRAFRQVNGMGRSGYATRGVYSAVFRRRGAFKARYPRSGKHVEFDWSRQVVALLRGKRVVRAYYVSSGTSATPTVFGSWRFYRKDRGFNALGMLHSNYFVGGYAIHGYKSVPTYPASHGCIRVPIPQARSIDRWIDIGDRIFTYR